MFILNWLWNDFIDGTAVEKIAILLLLIVAAVFGMSFLILVSQVLTLPLYV